MVPDLVNNSDDPTVVIDHTIEERAEAEEFFQFCMQNGHSDGGANTSDSSSGEDEQTEEEMIAENLAVLHRYRIHWRRQRPHAADSEAEVNAVIDFAEDEYWHLSLIHISEPTRPY